MPNLSLQRTQKAAPLSSALGDLTDKELYMDIDSLIKRSTDLIKEVQKIEKTRKIDGVSLFQVNNIASQAANLIYSVTGSKSSYAENLKFAQKNKTATGQYLAVAGVIQAFHIDLANGYLVNIRQEVEAVVVSEILSQARKLLNSRGIHPAAAVIVACAGIEEFLRNWCEQKAINIPKKQRSLSKYAQELRSAGEFSLPVERRIQSWADYRNNAAHGSKWDSISKQIAEKLVGEIEDFIIDNQQILGS